jgi:RNA polymerase sigma-70 factor (ECF subfamily)
MMGRRSQGAGSEVAVHTDLSTLYSNYVRTVYAFIYSKVGNREAAEDLTSEVFMKAVAHLDTARDERSIVAWLYRVARNATNDYWRASRDIQVIDIDIARIGRTMGTSPDIARQEITARRAASVLSQLPANYRTVLECRILESLSVAETAKRMGISEANVKVLQHRALKRAAELREDGDTNEQ